MHYPNYVCDLRGKYNTCKAHFTSSDGVFHCAVCSYDVCWDCSFIETGEKEYVPKGAEEKKEKKERKPSKLESLFKKEVGLLKNLDIVSGNKAQMDKYGVKILPTLVLLKEDGETAVTLRAREDVLKGPMIMKKWMEMVKA